eukprot:8088389-Lingulodinium_polyedra.AAC.1
MRPPARRQGIALRWRPSLGRRGCASWRAARPVGATAVPAGGSGTQCGGCAVPRPSRARRRSCQWQRT